MNTLTAKDIIEKYNLEPHIEGGYFREDFKSEILLPDLIAGKGGRSIITTCFYLIPKGEKSVFHRLTSDEIWNFHLGGSVDSYEITPQGKLNHLILGPDIKKNQQIKYLVKRRNWFGVLPQQDTDFAFFSTIVFPGFEYTDWERGDSIALKKLCPSASKIIDLLT